MKLMHYVSSNISLPKKSQLSLELLWSLWQWNSVTEQSASVQFSCSKVDKMPLCGQQGESSSENHREVKAQGAHQCPRCGISCPSLCCHPTYWLSSLWMHTGKQHLQQYHKDCFRKLGLGFVAKHEEMDLHCFSHGLACSMFTAFVVVSVVVLRILKFRNSVWQDLRFYFPYILIKINVEL